MTQTTSNFQETNQYRFEAVREQLFSPDPISTDPREALPSGASRQGTLRELPAPQVACEPQAEDNRQLLHLHHGSSSTFMGSQARTELKEIERADLEAFIEHEQDRGMHISTVRTRMASIIAFLHFLMEQDIIPGHCLQETDQAEAPRRTPPGHATPRM